MKTWSVQWKYVRSVLLQFILQNCLGNTLLVPSPNSCDEQSSKSWAEQSASSLLKTEIQLNSLRFLNRTRYSAVVIGTFTCPCRHILVKNILLLPSYVIKQSLRLLLAMFSTVLLNEKKQCRSLVLIGSVYVNWFATHEKQCSCLKLQKVWKHSAECIC